jgi:predicted ribosome quality control (RQC) complex YloA/Tae2 family protein
MDIFVLKALVDELRQRLCGAVVSKVFQMSPHDLLLRLWRHQDLRLLLSTQAAEPHLHLTTARLRNPPQPPRFAAFLRAHLTQVRLCDITVQPYERVVSFCWERPDEPVPTLRLLHTLQGPQANIILLDRHGIILDALKYVPAQSTSPRSILPGQLYQSLPLPPQRCLISDLTVETLQQLQAQGIFDAPHLQRLVVGLSPVCAMELVHRSQGEPQVCWELLQELRQHYEQSTLTLSLCTTPEGAKHLSALPLTHCAGTITSIPSAQDAVAALYEPCLGDTMLVHLRSTVQKTVRQRLHKLQRKITNLAQDRRTLEGYLPYQRYGTLLVAQRVPRGATSATVVDYYSPEQTLITIALDPSLSLHDNAQVYFKRARKAQHGLGKVQELLTQCVAEERHLEGVAQQIEQAEDWETLEAIATELGAPPTRLVTLRRVVSPMPAALPYRTFVLRDNSTVYCGKHNQGNDILLRQVAAPEDIWLHAHRQAGAHVVLKVYPHQEVAPQTLLQAAALAAFYSKGKEAASVEVIYTRVKYVRKFRGARPGQVQVSEYRMVEVAPQLPEVSRS